jgi:phosphomethylpyrimidine synthase
VYEALARVNGNVDRLSADLLIEVIRDQAMQGVDFMTLHAGLLRRLVPYALGRKLGIVSRGGAILAQWMSRKKSENPIYARWDDILDICRRHDVTVSLGDGLRPGCLADAGDRAQYGELAVLGKLVQSCRKAGVQVMVEGPGHVPFNEIPAQVRRQQAVCRRAPFYVLGPVVMDAAPGYDHITAAIGATSAAFHGAALLCYVTPAEHLALPTGEEVRTGVVAFRIAAHAADVARGLPGARVRDDLISDARRRFDWKEQFRLALDGKAARDRFMKGKRPHAKGDHCSMCGRDFCAIRASGELVKCHDAG